MRRRLALAILLTVWAVLFVGSVSVYLGVRTIVVRDLDSLLFARASALPELYHPGAFDPAHIPVYDWNDRYVIRDSPDPATTAHTGPNAPGLPRLISAHFTRDADRQRWRTLTIAAQVAQANRPPRPVLVEYSGLTDRIDALLRKVALALLGFGLAGGVLTAGVAMWVSAIVMRPLRTTAQWINAIDERTLDARVSLDRLPPELLPVSDRLNSMLSKLEKAFEDRKQFLASASHELRSPVTALSAGLNEADGLAHDPDAARAVLRRCISQTDILKTLVDRLTEYVTEAQHAPEEPQPVDVVAVIQECVQTAQAIGRASHVTVRRTGPNQLRCVLALGRLQSIVMNLLANAVEYNRPGGSVEIAFFHDARQLHLRVSDDGQGVAPEHVPHLFEPFYRAGGASEQAGGHLGLGLFIVQTHVKALNGVARIDSREGHGTAIEVEFPCQPLVTDHLAAV